MKRKRLIWIVTYLITITIFGWSLFDLVRAVHYQPATPERNPLLKYDYRIKPASVDISRYRELLADGLFFERASVPVTSPVPQAEFHSDLVVIGIVKGQDGRAIVGMAGDPNQETWIVKPGSVVEGETIVEIGRDYLEVRNPSGTGKVKLRK